MPTRPRNRIKPNIMHNHAQHGQSAFNPNAGIKLNEAAGGACVVVAYTIDGCRGGGAYITVGCGGGGSGETCIFVHITNTNNKTTYNIHISSWN